MTARPEKAPVRRPRRPASDGPKLVYAWAVERSDEHGKAILGIYAGHDRWEAKREARAAYASGHFCTVIVRQTGNGVILRLGEWEH